MQYCQKLICNFTSCFPGDKITHVHLQRMYQPWFSVDIVDMYICETILYCYYFVHADV
jgi:hypothetical protein